MHRKYKTETGAPILLPLEEDILRVARALYEIPAEEGSMHRGEFHAYVLAKVLAESHGDSLLANGTLYRSLRGLASRGFLAKRVETDEESETHAGPPRRYYHITATGVAALDDSRDRVKLDVATLSEMTATRKK